MVIFCAIVFGQKPTVLDTADSKSVRGGTFTDTRDGKTYKTTKIGEQVWMAENLNYNASGSKCYGSKIQNCYEYGRLYDWNTAKEACPSGWHLPSNGEWDKLYRFADGTSGTESPYKSEVAGKYLKAKEGWKDYDGKSGNGEDTYGFLALPGGFGTSADGFNSIGSYSVWWSSSEGSSFTAYGRFMFYGDEHAHWDYYDKSGLYSVRCVQGPAPKAEKAIKIKKASSFSAGYRWGTWAANTVIPGAGSIIFMDDFTGAFTQWVLLGGGIPLFFSEPTPYYGKIFNNIGISLIVSDILFNAYRSATYEKPSHNDINSGERAASLVLNLALPGAGYIYTAVHLDHGFYYNENVAVFLVLSALGAWVGYPLLTAGIFKDSKFLIGGGILFSCPHVIGSILHATSYGKSYGKSSYGGFNLAVLPTRNGNGVAYGLMYNKGF
jgi:uncharacterized protein (TIGR02145 family)